MNSLNVTTEVTRITFVNNVTMNDVTMNDVTMNYVTVFHDKSLMNCPIVNLKKFMLTYTLEPVTDVYLH